MQLHLILQQLDTIEVHGADNRSIDSITHDSRTAGVNDIFVAIRGDKNDGRAYAPNLNVAAVIADAPVEVRPGVVKIIVPDARKALAYASAARNEHPSHEMFVIGITGTNGKSTTAGIVEHMFHSNNIGVGTIGTIGHRLFGRPVSTQDGRTTPEASTMQKLLRSWRNQGCKAVVMEASSIGLAWNRVDGI
jgi:UDP-N-acetylmuramoyl-L-alanyl-D-glutamate--2,6-diaminopimelate ligase